MKYVNLYRDLYYANSLSKNHFLRWAMYPTKKEAYLDRLRKSTGYEYIRTIGINSIIREYELSDITTTQLFPQVKSEWSGIISYPTTL